MSPDGLFGAVFAGTLATVIGGVILYLILPQTRDVAASSGRHASEFPPNHSSNPESAPVMFLALLFAVCAFPLTFVAAKLVGNLLIGALAVLFLGLVLLFVRWPNLTPLEATFYWLGNSLVIITGLISALSAADLTLIDDSDPSTRQAIARVYGSIFAFLCSFLVAVVMIFRRGRAVTGVELTVYWVGLWIGAALIHVLAANSIEIVFGSGTLAQTVEVCFQVMPISSFLLIFLWHMSRALSKAFPN